METLGARGGPLGDVLGAALEQQAFVRKILLRRGMLHALHHRVLLALLANVPDPSTVTSVIQQLFPGEDPGALLLTWAEELSGPDLRGASGLSFTADRLAELRACRSDRPRRGPAVRDPVELGGAEGAVGMGHLSRTAETPTGRLPRAAR